MKTYYQTDPGKVRSHNEDSVNIVKNRNNEYLVVVADGMGGREQGDVASQEVVADVESWFYNADIDILRKIDYVSDLLDSQVKKTNKYLIDKYGKNYLGTTLTVAIIGRDKTLFYNIGDSRGYIYKEKALIQNCILRVGMLLQIMGIKAGQWGYLHIVM